MSDTAAYLMVGAYGVIAILLIVDELRHRFFQPAWACEKCGAGPLEANGPASVFDGRKGFECPSCGHAMQAYRSKVVLVALLVTSLAVAAGCAAIIVLNWNPDDLGLTRRPVFYLMYAGVILGPVVAGLCLGLMRKPMPVRYPKRD